MLGETVQGTRLSTLDGNRGDQSKLGGMFCSGGGEGKRRGEVPLMGMARRGDQVKLGGKLCSLGNRVEGTSLSTLDGNRGDQFALGGMFCSGGGESKRQGKVP